MPAAARTLSDVPSFQTAVLSWWEQQGRSLNFRRRRDPYAVLVSEFMAQQTQISRVEPAWESFMLRFPTVEALAASSTADVLRAWAGMGYNLRALNLQRAARVVVAEFGGRFPESVDDLQRLPGVGPYTARAVAAIAFGQPVGAVDTNVRRVLGRVAGGWDGMPPADLQVLADGLVPAGRAGEWTHGLMDVGARFCRPATPLCEDCPARPWCAAAASARPTPRVRPAGAGGRTSGRPTQPFRSTTRWLRGRLVDRARATEGHGWFRIDGPIDPHDEAAVGAAARGLAADGLLELDPTDPMLARLPR